MRKIAFLALILSSIYNYGQTEIIPNQTLERPFIEVIGTARKEVVPDKISISVLLSDKMINKKSYDIKSQEIDLKNTLTRLGIDLNNLFLSDAHSIITKRKRKETGFKVTKEFLVIVNSAKLASDLFNELHKINIKEASILKAESSEITKIRREVRISAIKAAKEKAEYLLVAIGEEIDKPIEIREHINNQYNYTQSNTIITSSSLNDFDTDFKKITIKYSYYIKYSLK